MTPFEELAATAGTWRGPSVLKDPHNNLDETCESTMTLTPVLRATFVRLDYTWDYKGAPQEGTMLIGYQPKSGDVTTAWADTWHMSRAMMISRGTASSDRGLDVMGHYPAPPGPDWGWRTQLRCARDEIRLTMYNVTPDGEEALAVDATYRRDR
jgi:hypothetical protein